MALDSLGFLRPIWGFSMGYDQSKEKENPRGVPAARERASINGPLEPAHLALRLLRAAVVPAEGWRGGFDRVGQEVFSVGRERTNIEHISGFGKKNVTLFRMTWEASGPFREPVSARTRSLRTGRVPVPAPAGGTGDFGIPREGLQALLDQPGPIALLPTAPFGQRWFGRIRLLAVMCQKESRPVAIFCPASRIVNDAGAVVYVSPAWAKPE